MKSKLFLLLSLLFFLPFLSSCQRKDAPTPLRIAIPESDYVQDLKTNYYVGWLKERLNLELEFLVVRRESAESFMEELFSSGTELDAVLFGNGFSLTKEQLSEYAKAGRLHPREDGSYSYSNYGSAPAKSPTSILWINTLWLKQLGLPLPEDTDSLREVLRAFLTQDPNGNGLADEIPFAGASGDPAHSPVEFILNSFVGDYSPGYEVSEEFRRGISYCASLSREGLLPERYVRGEMALFTELVNSPENLVGAFTTASISQVIYPDDPEILSRYMHIPPLTGPEGVRGSAYAEKTPEIGGLVLSGSPNREVAACLLSLMETPEASLIARYGEQGVDWDFSDGLDVSIDGGLSTIATVNYLWNTPQNKHLNGIGPMRVPEEYLRGVTWNGVNSDTEYIDERARMSYLDAPQISPRLPSRLPSKALSSYVEDSLNRFIFGEGNVDDEAEWEDYVKGALALSEG